MLKRKMLRDVGNYKVQFISIFLMAFIGVFVFTGMYAETASYETTIDNYYEQSNMADGWIYSNYLVDEFIHQVDCLGATTQMERQLVVDSQANLEGMPNVILHFVENNTISKFYLTEGKKLDINDSQGVWLDKNFAEARNLKVGDEISFENNGTKIKKTIRGLGYSPEYIFNTPKESIVPNYTSTGFAYMSHKAYPSNNIPYNVLNVKFDGTPETFLKLLSYRLDGYFTAFIEKTDHPSADAVEESISQQHSVSSALPPIFIIISMVMLSTTMKRIITHQRNEIGILKANGFKNNKIALHYISIGTLVVLLASILGAIIGPVAFHMIAHPSRTLYFKFPYWNSIGFITSAITVILMGIISVIVSYYSIEQIINEPPSITIKPMAPKLTTSEFVETLKIWKRLSFNIRWNYRNIKRNKFRAMTTIIGVFGCTILLITGLGLYEQIDDSKDWYFNDVNHFESKLIIDDDLNLSQINSISQKVNGSPIMESSVEIIKDKTEVASLVVTNNSDLITLTNDNHDKIDLQEDEVSISKKMAEMMNISVGDTIDCRTIGSYKDIHIKIDKIHSSPFSQGLVMSPHKLEQLGFNYTPTSIVTSKHITQDYDGIRSVTYLNDMSNQWDKMEETSMIIISSLIIFSVILALVILYNLNSISFTEMENEIATLKILGFKTTYLAKLLATQSLAFIIVGFLLGIPISYYILSILITLFGKDIYLVPTISLTNLVVTFVIIISVSMIMNLYFLRKIRKFDMANYLK